ncbi:MAG: endolytic transglycosylase MltG [Eubacterium sp.]|nr:endolytic transglycosylase MltG [Eubacterium sp.]
MGRTGNRRKKKTHYGILIILLLIIAAGLWGMIRVTDYLEPVDPNSKEEIAVVVEQGSTAYDIGALLEEKGLIRSARVFYYFSKFKKLSSGYQAGAYAMSKSMSMEEIANMITSGDITTISFTIPEGLTEYDIAKKLSEVGLVDYDEFVDLLEDGRYRKEYSFLKKAQKGKHYLEGYLFPNTYRIPTGSDQELILETMLDGYSSIFTDEYREKAKKLGMTENEIIVMASIIEREGYLDEDRPKIASVIYNRIAIDMPLQMDSTVSYAMDPEGEKKMQLTYDDTEFESKYNTYLYTGLPPGPICCPGKASIDAALNPADTDYLYFVLSDKLDGSSVFSDNDEDFERDKAAYYEALEAEENGD